MPALEPDVKQTYDALGYDPKKVYEALVEVQRAFARNDFESFLKLASLPFRINRKPAPPIIVKSRQDLRRHRDLIFSAHNATVVKAQKFEDLVLRDEGAVVGNGELWISGTCTDGGKAPCRYGVIMLNVM